jgi:hypothetical protein
MSKTYPTQPFRESLQKLGIPLHLHDLQTLKQLLGECLSYRAYLPLDEVSDPDELAGIVIYLTEKQLLSLPSAFRSETLGPSFKSTELS